VTVDEIEVPELRSATAKFATRQSLFRHWQRTADAVAISHSQDPVQAVPGVRRDGQGAGVAEEHRAQDRSAAPAP
jgi:hypothetical protein